MVQDAESQTGERGFESFRLPFSHFWEKGLGDEGQQELCARLILEQLRGCSQSTDVTAHEIPLLLCGELLGIDHHFGTNTIDQCDEGIRFKG